MKNPAFLIPLFWLLTSCGKPSAALDKLPEQAVILAFGDSLTYGTGATRRHDYPSLLARLTSRQVINAGRPGEISAEGLRRLPDLLDTHEPDLLILIHGGNDMLRKIPAKQTVENLKAMIRLARDRDIAVVMLAVPRPSLLWLSGAAFYQPLAESLDVPIDTETLPEVLSDNRLKSDAIHPNDRGYARIAAQIHALLIDSGAL